MYLKTPFGCQDTACHDPLLHASSNHFQKWQGGTVDATSMQALTRPACHAKASSIGLQQTSAGAVPTQGKKESHSALIAHVTMTDMELFEHIWNQAWQLSFLVSSEGAEQICLVRSLGRQALLCTACEGGKAGQGIRCARPREQGHERPSHLQEAGQLYLNSRLLTRSLPRLVPSGWLAARDCYARGQQTLEYALLKSMSLCSAPRVSDAV